MKNIINYDIDFNKISTNIKKFLYIDDSLLHSINCKDDWEPLVIIDSNKILTKSYALDKPIKTSDKETNYIINLENIITKKYSKNYKQIYVRYWVYEKLININQYFKNKWFQILVKSGYRSLIIQNILFEKLYKYFKNKFPDNSDENNLNITREYVADPSYIIPPHSTWWAIDIILIDDNENILDMWSPINYPDDISNLTTNKINMKQANNRIFLADSMINYWFANLPSEWWHFSYWDNYWAKFYWKKESIYCSV